MRLPESEFVRKFPPEMLKDDTKRRLSVLIERLPPSLG